MVGVEDCESLLTHLKNREMIAEKCLARRFRKRVLGNGGNSFIEKRDLEYAYLRKRILVFEER